MACVLELAGAEVVPPVSVPELSGVDVDPSSLVAVWLAGGLLPPLEPAVAVLFAVELFEVELFALSEACCKCDPNEPPGLPERATAASDGLPTALGSNVWLAAAVMGAVLTGTFLLA